MKKYILFFIVSNCSLLSGRASSVFPDSATLNSFIIKYGLQQKDPMILITLNPDENPVYKAPLAAFHDSIQKNKLEKKVVYLFRSLRQVEAKYYFTHNMNFSPAEEEMILSDDDFYSTVNSTANSCIVLIKGGQIIQRFTPFDALSQCRLNVRYTVQNTLKDSVKMDESIVPISKKNKFIIKDSRLFLADMQYNNVSAYNIRTGTMLAGLDMSYDHAGLYKTFISPDPAKIAFTGRVRKLVSKSFNMNEFYVLNISIRDSAIYIPCTITYGELNKNRDTAFTRYGFLLKTDLQLKKINYYYFPYPEDFTISDENAFYAENDSTFIYSVLPTSPRGITGNKVLARFVLRHNKIVFKNMTDLSLPEYFIKTGIQYGYKLSDVYNFRNKNFLYFKLQVPESYSLSDHQVISYPDSSFKEPDSWGTSSKMFISVYIYPVNDKTLGYFTNEKGKDYISLWNVDDQKLLVKQPLPERFLGARISGLNKNYYLLQPEKNDLYLYHFELK